MESRLILAKLSEIKWVSMDLLISLNRFKMHLVMSLSGYGSSHLEVGKPEKKNLKSRIMTLHELAARDNNDTALPNVT